MQKLLRIIQQSLLAALTCGFMLSGQGAPAPETVTVFVPMSGNEL